MTQEPLSGLVVCLPQAEFDDVVGVVEVLVQEGLNQFSLAADDPNLDLLSAMYSSRARFGACRVSDAEQVELAVTAGASFVFSDVAEADVLQAAQQVGVPCYLQAFSPTEIREVIKMGATGAQLFPADVLGHGMAERLAEQELAKHVVPMGGMGAFATGEWFEAGAPAVCLGAVLLGTSLSGGDLGKLRERCASFRDNPKVPPS